jgi:ribosome recycling factor
MSSEGPQGDGFAIPVQDNNLPILVFNLNKHGNIKKPSGRRSDLVHRRKTWSRLLGTRAKMKVSADHFPWTSKVDGRANLSLFEDIKVEYYGTLTPVNQLANLGIPDPTLITVQPWDPTLLEPIDKAIRAADLGLNPLNDGKTLKVPIPPLDDERRREMAKKIKKMLEDEYGSPEHAPREGARDRSSGDEGQRGRQV